MGFFFFFSLLFTASIGYAFLFFFDFLQTKAGSGRIKIKTRDHHDVARWTSGRHITASKSKSEQKQQGRGFERALQTRWSFFGKETNQTFSVATGTNSIGRKKKTRHNDLLF